MLVKVKGFPWYAVDEEGNVHSLKKGIILKPYFNRVGYPRVKLYHHGHMEQFFVHLLVFKTFTNAEGLNEKGLHVDHIDRIKTHNSLTNLRVVTREQNMKNRVFKSKKVVEIPFEDPYAEEQNNFFIK